MFDDRQLITAGQLAALRPALRYPTVYTQRLLESLDFLPHGGQTWRRDLQLLIPAVEGLPDEDQWFIVSLGQFKRRRLPDFTVTDCSGRSLNLLTRVQHGHCLTEFTVDQYLKNPERDEIVTAARKDPSGEVATAYADVYKPTFEMFTTVGRDLAPVAEGRFVRLLTLVGAEADAAEETAALFMKDMRELGKVTQYLCWVRARPGSVVRLTATYTMPDPFSLAGPDPGDGAQQDKLARVRRRFRIQRSEVYARLGLGPVHYEFLTPANDHAGSYYFTMQPPPESSIAYLDWGLQNTLEHDEEEWICAHNSVHVHNGASPVVRDEKKKQPRTKIPGSKIHAFIRLDPADHKQVLFAALLNLVFVWLAEAGRLSPEIDGTATPWLALTPAVLVAYAAQQRRHYFAGATRWVRAVIWGYLVLNIVFLVSVTFDIASNGSFASRHGFSDDVVSILMGGASIVVFFVFAFVGRPYEWLVRRSFSRLAGRRDGKRTSPEKQESTVHSYVRVARWYGNLVAFLAVLSLAGMAAVLLTGHGPTPPPEEVKSAKSRSKQKLVQAGSRNRAEAAANRRSASPR